MKGFIATALLVLFLSTAAWAGPFGPPEPFADPGKFSLELGYSFDRTGMKQDGDRLGLRSHQYFLQGDYSLIKDWEVYGRFGAADERVFDRDLHKRFTDGAEPYGSLGFKGVLYRYNNFALGPFVEGSWYGDHSGLTKNQWDANLGMSAQYKLSIVRGYALTVYGGPFAYLRQADSETSTLPQDDMKERHNLGGFLGVSLPVFNPRVVLNAEAQMKERLGGGLSLGYKF